MSIITKTEICDNVPASLPLLNFQALIGDMKRIESLSNEKIMELENRLQEKEDETKSLRRRNEELKSSLSAKERDCKLYYDQYQKIAKQFEEFKTKFGKDVELPKPVAKIEAEIEPAIVVFDTDSENEENQDETILFTSPDLFSEPAFLEEPRPDANSTELTSLNETDQTTKPAEQLSLKPTFQDKPSPTTISTALQTLNPSKKIESQLEKSSAVTKKLQLGTITAKTVKSKELTPKKSQSEKMKRPIAIARKRAGSDSQRKSGAPPKKSRYTPKKLPTPTHFKCKTCPKLSFEKMEEYHEHLNEIHPEKTYLCGYCPYATSKSSDIDIHIERQHSTVHNTNYNCQLCKISFSSTQSFLTHLRFYH